MHQRALELHLCVRWVTGERLVRRGRGLDEASEHGDGPGAPRRAGL